MTEEARRELSALAERYGTPRLVSARIRDGFFDPIKRPDRFGEVCMVVRRPNGTVLLTTKDFYPGGAFRLPTGGIAHGEGILDALLRETHEETGLTAEVRRFLAWIDYEGSGEGRVVFHTFAFLLEETGGTLGSLDPHERIAAYREAAPEELVGIADHLDSIASELSPDIEGDWADWGRFRAVVHRAVAEALA
ncbi:MAG: NUDIX hydrolase [Candidatus Rokubacteria bacterium]|nr:NUDIX hydrolase [Candidatus Rokubacteria bacterium]